MTNHTPFCLQERVVQGRLDVGWADERRPQGRFSTGIGVEVVMWVNQTEREKLERSEEGEEHTTIKTQLEVTW